jgi:Na+-translocating ferredoxin:NAD+ oxidoreductase subunit B
MNATPYQTLAARLDSLPNGFPPAPDGSDLRLLEKIFTPEEAALACQLEPFLETVEQIASRIGGQPDELRQHLKQMSRKGLISAGQFENGLGYKLMPFVVGIYEMQLPRLDAEMALLFERYYKQSFSKMLSMKPAVHRVIPVNESIQAGVEIHPYESAVDIIRKAAAWGVLDCICRVQKTLLGQPCSHPVDVCLAMSSRPGAFDRSDYVRALSKEEAAATLRRAAEAGLVHTVSNNQIDVWYICSCCTCSCGILRGLSEFGIAGVAASSAYVNQVDPDACIQCGDCLERCQFNALALNDRLHINKERCVGCGVCTLACPSSALSLILRERQSAPPISEQEWLEIRTRHRAL